MTKAKRYSLGLLIVVLLAGAGAGCAGPNDSAWGRSATYHGFSPETLNRGGEADFTILVPLAQLFYQRVEARRFDSLATFEDPALREFFRTERAFADYYAAFAEALTRARFESNRPTAVTLKSMDRTGPSTVSVRVLFRGENALPLRWWSTETVREDVWAFSQGRWWIVPGKV
ncbi:MAG: hypothetical protein P8Q97_13025 [Myxococcota bacterium]|jgi:hypothetical protein|nr:hypothetical protein [Myxococcota bacterium]